VIRVLLVDDQALIRAGFRALLAAEDDIEVVAEGANGAEAVALAARYHPDVALIDIQMPVLDGIEATRRIAADPALAGTHVVILTNDGLDEYVYTALRAGAGGFLVKDTEPARGVRVRVRARRPARSGGMGCTAPAVRPTRGEPVVSPPGTAARPRPGAARPPSPGRR
jgi:DNA-binding NarL/FixJ family response regulator